MMNNLELPESPYLEFVVYSCILRPPPKKGIQDDIYWLCLLISANDKLVVWVSVVWFSRIPENERDCSEKGTPTQPKPPIYK